MEYTITEAALQELCKRYNVPYDEVLRFVCISNKRHDTETNFGNIENDFEAFWLLYKRKGNKKTARQAWQRLTEQQRRRALEHAPRYIASRELQYCKDAERYLKHEVFNDEIFTNAIERTTDATITEVRNYRDSLFHALGLSGVVDDAGNEVTGGAQHEYFPR
jgi:hypothetical protein